MNYKEKIKEIIKRDSLDNGSKRREHVYKKMVLANIMRSLEISHEKIAAMFNVFTKTGFGDHSSSINWEKKYNDYSVYPDFEMIEEAYLKELKIRTKDEIFDESVIKKVLHCDTFWEFSVLKEELKKQIEHGKG